MSSVAWLCEVGSRQKPFVSSALTITVVSIGGFVGWVVL